METERPKWPMFVDRMIDEYGFDPDEFRVYAHISCVAGYDTGKWCQESAEKMAKTCYLSVRKLGQVLNFLVEARTIKKRGSAGATIAYQPVRPTEWADPAQLPLIRNEVYKRSDGTVNVRLIGRAKRKQAAEYSAQKSLTGYALLAAFTVTKASEEWALREYGRIDLAKATHEFIIEVKKRIQDGWKIESADLQAEWRKFIVQFAMRLKQAPAEARLRATNVGHKKSGQSDDPLNHPAVMAFLKVFEKPPTIYGRELIAAQIKNLELWKEVCSQWKVDYQRSDTHVRVSKLLQIYAEREARGGVEAAVRPVKPSSATIGRSQPKIDLTGETTLHDLVETFGATALEYEWMIETFGEDEIRQEMAAQGIEITPEAPGRKQA